MGWTMAMHGMVAFEVVGGRLMRRSILAICFAVLSTVSMASLAHAQEVTKETVPGVTNLARLQTTVACSGAIKVEAVPEIKKMGFVSIINLRESNEPGANVEAEEAAAKEVGLHYFHIPFNGAMPSTAAVDKFIEAITGKETEPAFIHCAGGNRAATMWFIKRLVVDHWDEDRAWKEASALGMTSQPLREFGVHYAETHKRG
jgi:uncharacterized protein (TIGR01244 family)